MAELDPHPSLGPGIAERLGRGKPQLMNVNPLPEVLGIGEQAPHGLTKLPGLFVQALLVCGPHGGEQAGQFRLRPAQRLLRSGVGGGRGAGLVVPGIEAPAARDDHDVRGNRLGQVPPDGSRHDGGGACSGSARACSRA